MLSDAFVPCMFRAKVSGIQASGYPLPGFGGFDCSQYNCPIGDNVRYRNNYGGNFEIQHVCVVLNDLKNIVLTMFHRFFAQDIVMLQIHSPYPCLMKPANRFMVIMESIR